MTDRAIALCRVSTPEQLANNSLPRQEEAVRDTAKLLKVVIPDDYWWSGSMSSKRGTNVNRKDLQWAVKLCKKDKRVKYVIVPEPDRFMRSIGEAFYYETLFEQEGAKVWYCDPELNTNDLKAKMLRFMKYFVAEGSNEERQVKSISGHEKALREGRFTFPCRMGYVKGARPGVHMPHPIIAPVLKSILERVSKLHTTPQQGMKEMNITLVMIGHAPLKMDKWRKVITDPYYAGILEMNKQVKVRNENGQHEALISADTHQHLVEIMCGRPKTQTGPLKNGNPRYPCNNIVTCTLCDAVGIKKGRVVGFPVKNGRYEKYRCRGCGRYMSRQELHDEMNRRFKPISPDATSTIVKALDKAWKRQEKTIIDQAKVLQRTIDTLEVTITAQAVQAILPENAPIKPQLMKDIESKKERIAALKSELIALRNKSTADKTHFLKFALDFVNNIGQRFLQVSKENRLRLELLLFPGGFFVNENKKVLTPEVSPFYRLITTKNRPKAVDLALMVRVTGL